MWPPISAGWGLMYGNAHGRKMPGRESRRSFPTRSRSVYEADRGRIQGRDVMANRSTDKEKVIILGAGPFAEDVADLISQTVSQEVVGFVEGLDRQRCAHLLLGLPVWWVEEIGPFRDTCKAVCAVGTPKREVFIAQAYAQGLPFTTVIHPAARVSATSRLGEGTIVGPGVVVASHTVIGRHVVVNRGSLIGHHVRIDDYATICPGVNIAGRAHIGAASFLGMGAIIIDGVSVGRHCLIAAGAVVTRDVPERTRLAGVPARAF